MQPAQQADQPLVQAVDGQLLAGVFAELLDVFLQLLLRGGDDLLDPRGWMRPSAMSLFRARRATSRRIVSKPLTMTTPGRVVDDQVDAGGLFEGADVAALAADDPPLHFVVGNAHRAGRRLGGMRGRVTLERR